MLRSYIEEVLRNYKTARNENFKQHSMAKLLKKEFPNYLKKIIGNSNKYKFSGSPGRGTWAHCPWVAVLNKSITETAQSGFYPVYLFKENMEGVYLSLNQGTDKLKETKKSRTKNILRSRSQDYRNRISSLTNIPNDFLESIDLTDNNNSNAPFYEAGNIYAKYYSLKNLPSEKKLESDLKEILKIYDLLVSEGSLITTTEDSIEDSKFPKNTSFYSYLLKSGYFFDPKIVENFLLSLKVKPFVILTGNSGTGKTKLAQLFARYKSSQYRIVPVGANWTENRHLLGFYNIITKDYQGTAALDLIEEASNNQKIPHFLVLDEMNLSHVERYFADFLSSMESEEPIPLHSNRDEDVPNELKIPNNLLVVGTVNVDETTYMFSPKVLDRANTIEFSTCPAEDYMLNNHKTYNPLNTEYIEDPLSNQDIRNCRISKLKEELENVTIDGKIPLWDILAGEITEFQKVLKKAGFDFGFRVIDEILRFMYVAWIYENRPETWDNWMRYFDAQIKQKMLPKLHGSQRVLEDVLRELLELCYPEAVDVPPHQLGDIQGEETLKYPSSALKIQEMSKVLYEQRYVSFIN